jgi:hypothetical protein
VRITATSYSTWPPEHWCRLTRWRWPEAIGYVRSLRTRSLTPLFVAALSFAYFLTYPLAIGKADESHLLYGAKRILEGEVIYKDFFEILTPLAYYLFAGIFRVAGTSLLAARVGMAGIEALGCGLLFHLTRRVSGGVEATLVTLIFAGVCIPTWPYASPHWVSTVLGLLVATVTLARTGGESSRARPLVAGILAGVAVCVQQQRGVFLAAWLPLALCILVVSHPRGTRLRTLAGEIAWGAAGGAIVVLVVLGPAVWRASPAAVYDALYTFNVTVYPRMAGRVPWAAALWLAREFRAPTWILLLRLSPLFLVVEAMLLLRVRRRFDRHELERASLWVLAALTVLSILYLPDFIHVSFILAFLLLPGASALHALRTAPVWDRVPAGRRVLTAAVWLAAVGVLGQAIANVAYARAVAPVRFETAFGVVQGTASSERLLRAVRAHLVREPDGTRLLYSYPDDAWLYLTVPASDATRNSILFESFFPPDKVQEIVGLLRAHRPGTVVVLLLFSSDQISKVIEEEYDPVEDVGPYRIFVRREARTPGARAPVRTP